MKKTLILSIAILMVASCGKSGYQTVTPNLNGSQGATTVGSDAYDSFSGKWIVDGTPGSITPEGMRGLANFFGYNTAHYTNSLDGCYYGYTDETSMNHYTGASCFSSSNTLSNYFTAATNFIFPGPAPMDLGSISSYRVRFAASINETTRELVPGNAYLQVILYSSNETLSREFTAMKVPMTVVSSLCSGNACDKITASFTDVCGTATLHANSFPSSSGTLKGVYISFRQSQSSYKNGKCYFDGRLPNGVALSYDITSSLPTLLDSEHSSVDTGNLDLFAPNVVDDLIEQ